MATAQPDLSKMSYNELRKLLEAAEAAVADKREEEIKVLVDGFVKKTEAAGFTVEEAIQALTPYLPARPTATRRAPFKNRGTSGPKYRDPANEENVWSGKGRPARWMKAYLDQGRSKDEFLAVK